MSKIGETACDVWALDVDMVINFIENPKKYQKTNVWIRKEVQPQDLPLVCRWSHTAGLVDNRNILLFGGIDQKLNAMRQVTVYDFLDHKFL